MPPILESLARANRLAELPNLLMRTERLRIGEVHPRRHGRGLVDAVARDLGIVHASKGETDYPASIYITLSLPHERSGGFVSDSGEALASWLEATSFASPISRMCSTSLNLQRPRNERKKGRPAKIGS